MLKEISKLIRLKNSLIAFIAVVLGYLLSNGNQIFLGFLGGLIAFSICALGNIANNIVDYRIDSKKKNPISAKKITIKKAWQLLIFFGLASIVMLFFTNIKTQILGIGIILALLIYAFKMRKVKYLGNVVVAGLTGITFVFGSLLTNHYNPVISYIAFAAFLINWGREITKDLEDYKKDSGFKITLPRTLGKKESEFLASIFIFGSFPLVVKVWKSFSIYYSLFSFASFLFFAYCVYLLLNKKYKQSQKFNKIGMVVYILGLIIEVVL